MFATGLNSRGAPSHRESVLSSASAACAFQYSVLVAITSDPRTLRYFPLRASNSS
jgi:hypothetical protein